MMPPLKNGATLPQGRTGLVGSRPNVCILRQWRASTLLRTRRCSAIPLSRALHYRGPQAPCDGPRSAGWRNAAIMAGHWALHGFGMFAVEEKSSGTFVGRVGPFYPPVWPGFRSRLGC